MANSRSRKWQITINNPNEHGINSKIINEIMNNISWIYYCFAYEIGAKEHTPHIHLFFYCKNAVSFDRVKKLFPSAHIEPCKGTSQDNRDYIRKEGRHADKNITSLPETFEEYGEMPLDASTKNDSVSADVLEMIKNGCSNAEIINKHPSYLSKINQLDGCRNELLNEENKNKWRDLDVEYIFGKTGTGKTRYVMDEFGYSNVCKITNYPKERPFSNYNNQPVLLLDEFHSGIPIGDMLQYLDGYPCLLPARYNDKIACYDKVFIISNIDLNKQYINVQEEKTEVWNAFVRRINRVTEFVSDKDFYIGVEPQTVKIEHDINKYIL